MELLFFVFLGLFFLAAIDDYRRHKVHNLIPAALWAIAGFSNQAWALPGAAVSFGLLIAITIVSFDLWNWLPLQWADILLIPMFIFGACFIRNKPVVLPFIVVGSLAPIIIATIRRDKEISAAPIIFFFYLMAGIAFMLTP